MNILRRAAIVLLLSAVTVAVTGVPGFTVHDLDLFELEGDAIDGSAAGDDWNTVLDGNPANDGAIGEAAFVADNTDPTDTTYLHTGGSKDIEDFSEWVGTTTDEAPDKDEIMNAYAVPYVYEGDLIVYFGADRYDADGDAAMGFWFVQEDISLSGTNYVGEHQVGDVLILSDFVNGGAVPEVRVFEWVGSGGSDGPLDEIGSAGDADCGTVADGDLRCAIVNADTEVAPWAFTNKSGDNDFAPGEFFEGGVNLTELLGETPCFNTFIAETRTSQETTARLKDIAMGDFSTCAKKEGTKFEDLNGDGDRDSGEPGLEDWTIHLYDDDDLHLTDTTDSTGAYSFNDLEPGEYTVCEEQQSGWTQSYPESGDTGTTACTDYGDGVGYAIDLDYGEVDSGNDFGNWQNASKSGTKFEDQNADGDKDTGEGGLEGVKIYVDLNDNDSWDSGEPYDLTDSDGAYSITGLAPGTYTFREVAPAGSTCSYPVGTCEWTVTLSSGEADTGNNFGNWFPATKSGTKFEDLNADGDRDSGEPGLSGWRIFVDYNDDGDRDAGEPYDDTDSDGAYTIEGINPGTYKVREVQQSGWTCSMPNPCYYNETFTSDDDMTGNDFGNWRTANKTGTKFHDLNADGDRDEGEPGLSGVTIYVDYNDNGSLDSGEPSAVSGDDGAYQITGVNPGTWKVREVTPNGWTCSYPVTTCAHTDTFSSGGTLTNNNFGNWRTATKSGTKFEDEDADGVWDSGEAGLPGVTIYVDYNDNGSLDSGEPSAVTGSTGAYMIEGVNPGTWKVREVTPSGWTCSYPNPCYHTDSFTSGAAVENNNFGNWKPATKAGAKFEDLNGDGDRDEGEDGLEGFVIYVDYNDNGERDEGEPFDETDSDGAYLITDITPGSYPVREEQQAGWTCSMPADCTYDEEFTSSDEFTGNDFGNWREATKSGSKFNDLDRDGVWDEGEPGLQGWEINIVGTAGSGEAVDETTATGPDGSYTLSVPPGEYLVCENLESELLWVQTHPATGADCSDNGGGLGYAIVLTSGMIETGNDFGNYLPNPDIEIVKTADPISGSPGDTITYTYVVTNTGEVTLFDISVDDDKLGHIGDIDELAVGASETLTATTTLGTAAIVNVAVAVGRDAIDREVSDDDDAEVTVVLPTRLAKTGSDLMVVAEFAFMLLAIGMLLVARSRRRLLVIEEIEE